MAEGSRLDLSLYQVGRIHVLCLNQRSAQLQPSSCNAAFAWRPIGLGGESGVVPPVPMPNTAVKRSSAHDTGVIKPRENRPVPGPFGRYTSKSRCLQRVSFLLSERVETYILSLPTRGGAVVARRAHNPKVSGSNPLPATHSAPIVLWDIDGTLVRSRGGRVSVAAFLRALEGACSLPIELRYLKDAGGKTDTQIAMELLRAAALAD